MRRITVINILIMLLLLTTLFFLGIKIVSPNLQHKKQLDEFQKEVADGNYEKAVELSEEIMTEDPLFKDTLLKLAREYTQEQDYMNAFKSYESLLETEPDNLMYLKEHLVMQEEWGNYTGVIRLLDKIVKHDDSIEILSKIVWYNRQLGAFEKALDYAGILIEREPEVAEWNYYMGEVLWYLEEPESASIYLGRAVRNEPANIEYTALYCDALATIEDYDKAIYILNESPVIGESGELQRKLTYIHSLALKDNSP